MSIEHVIASLVVLLLLAVLAEPLSRAVRLPYSSVLVVTGFVMSELVVMSGIDTGLRAESFHDLVFYVFIPVLVFESAYRINKRLLLENLVPVIVLAVIGLSLTASITALGLYYGIAHPVGFPLIAALLTGAILAATDPVAVVARLREIGHIANAIVFIVMGVTITTSMFEERWLAMLIAIAAVFVARAVSIYASLSVLGLVQSNPVDLRSQTVMVWGGLRGAVALALALSLPVTLDYWWTIQSIAFGVVLFMLFVQAPTIGLLVDRLAVRDRA